MSSDAYKVIGIIICFIILCVVSLVIPILVTQESKSKNNTSILDITILDEHGSLKERNTVSEFQTLMRKYTGICFSDYNLERAKEIEVEITRRFNGNSNIEFNLEFFRGDTIHLEARNVDLNKDYTIISKYKKCDVKRSIVVKVFENSFSKSTSKLSTIEGFQGTMKQYDCVPFTTEQIRKAISVETIAFGWSDTIFKLTFSDGTEIKQHACHV